MPTNQKVLLRGEPIWHEDEKAGEAITPGHLLEYSGGNLVKHATAGGFAQAMFADVRDEIGTPATPPGISVAYAANDQVKAMVCQPGVRINALMASGVAATKGAYLESAGDGTLRLQTSTNHRVARAVETKTAANTGLTRLRVEVV